jgi:hypothetical protein
MASVAATRSDTVISGVTSASWSLAAGDTGKPVLFAQFPDRTVTATATFGSVTLRGSNKAAPDDAVAGDWFNLTDPQGNAITLTAAGGKLIAENPLWISPITTGGSGYVVTVVGVQ